MQASTIQGILVLAGLFGVNLAPDLAIAISNVVAAIIGVIYVVKDGQSDRLFK
jgi:uncharacterized membrane protein